MGKALARCCRRSRLHRTRVFSDRQLFHWLDHASRVFYCVSLGSCGDRENCWLFDSIPQFLRALSRRRSASIFAAVIARNSDDIISGRAQLSWHPRQRKFPGSGRNHCSGSYLPRLDLRPPPRHHRKHASGFFRPSTTLNFTGAADRSILHDRI